MPLSSGSSRQVFSDNVKAEAAAGKPIQQAVAIAYSKARKGKKKKGSLNPRQRKNQQKAGIPQDPQSMGTGT
jgi:hypothetical protein